MLMATVLAIGVNALRVDRLKWPPPAPAANGHATEHLTAEKARQMHLAGQAIFADARSAEAFQKGHIPKAIHLPPAQMETWIDQMLETVAAEQPIVAYCSNRQCHLAQQLMEHLQLAGFEKVFHFEEGIQGWIQAGYPLESSDSRID